VVGDEVSGWNPFLDSLLYLAEQLEELGIVYSDGQAVYIVRYTLKLRGSKLFYD
jgi:hypothetical protein